MSERSKLVLMCVTIITIGSCTAVSEWSRYAYGTVLEGREHD